MCGKASALILGSSSVRASEIEFEEQAAVAGEGLAPVKVKIMTFEERVKPCSYTS